MKGKFKVIDNGYRCKKSYKGFGWLIEGNDSSDAPSDVRAFHNYIIKVDKRTFDKMSDFDDTFLKINYVKDFYLGFSNAREAKLWCERNPKV